MKRITIKYEPQDHGGEPLDLFAYIRNELDNKKIEAEIEEESVPVGIDGEIMVCSYCGSREVFSDAYVGINDPTDVLTYDDTHCMKCQGPCSTVTETEYKERHQS